MTCDHNLNLGDLLQFGNLGDHNFNLGDHNLNLGEQPKLGKLGNRKM